MESARETYLERATVQGSPFLSLLMSSIYNAGSRRRLYAEIAVGNNSAGKLTRDYLAAGVIKVGPEGARLGAALHARTDSSPL